jgi:hypothetical protein
MAHATKAQEKAVESLRNNIVVRLVWKGTLSLTIGDTGNQIGVDIDRQGNITSTKIIK